MILRVDTEVLNSAPISGVAGRREVVEYVATKAIHDTVASTRYFRHVGREQCGVGICGCVGIVCSRSKTDVPGVENAETVSEAEVAGFCEAIA